MPFDEGAAEAGEAAEDQTEKEEIECRDPSSLRHLLSAFTRFNTIFAASKWTRFSWHVVQLSFCMRRSTSLSIFEMESIVFDGEQVSFIRRHEILAPMLVI
eukprot:TRINITY_DN6746_c0_g2_i5.p2 TRINITY_DN6746_c0_g2~~TRINITY_DN6746_c0_g2_i5.p2  ORF type:complete len:101 (+),score=5.78 TRINITY_DN6746_c0_g2_i5:31-333(+)